MDRDVLLPLLVMLVCGPIAWAAPTTLGRRRTDDARVEEQRAWRAITLPLVAAGVALALLVGWAIREPPRADERLVPAGWVVVGAIGVMWTRALGRFVIANAWRPRVSIGVVGLWRPRIVVHPSVALALDREALTAALAHEEAHRRHHDPMRIAVARFACDLQWPWPQARQRLRGWLASLEEARDAEAVAAGANPDDLAAAILAVARHQAHPAVASLGGNTAIERRIARLVADPRPPVDVDARRSALGMALLLVAAGALVVGLIAGDDLLGVLPGVTR